MHLQSKLINNFKNFKIIKNVYLDYFTFIHYTPHGLHFNISFRILRHSVEIFSFLLEENTLPIFVPS